MKILHVFFLMCIASACSTASGQTPQNVKQDSTKVWGNCEMCKGRIEKAARAAGASTANWDVDSKILTISYASASTSMATIEKAVAGAGHDTGHATASGKAYKNLPECCQYERKSPDESDKN